jgi:two-component system NtrC family sensor kinase
MTATLLFAADETEADEVWLPGAHAERLGRPGGGPRRILVAEDDALVRGMLERMLSELGYEVHTARHGQEALSLAEGNDGTFDLVITDVRMPRMNGPELGRRLEERWPGIPVLYISGYDIEASTGPEAAHRRSAFMRKPFDPDELARRVARLLGEA